MHYAEYHRGSIIPGASYLRLIGALILNVFLGQFSPERWSGERLSGVGRAWCAPPQEKKARPASTPYGHATGQTHTGICATRHAPAASLKRQHSLRGLGRSPSGEVQEAGGGLLPRGTGARSPRKPSHGARSPRTIAEERRRAASEQPRGGAPPRSPRNGRAGRAAPRTIAERVSAEHLAWRAGKQTVSIQTRSKSIIE